MTESSPLTSAAVMAEEIVTELFADLRDRRFLKWLFKKEEAVIGDFPALRSLDLDVQQEIRDDWAAIIKRSALATLSSYQATQERDETAALAAATELLACVTFDSDGIMVGMVRQGGNGGMLSNKTLRAADALRRALDDLKASANE